MLPFVMQVPELGDFGPMAGAFALHPFSTRRAATQLDARHDRWSRSRARLAIHCAGPKKNQKRLCPSQCSALAFKKYLPVIDQVACPFSK